MSEPRVQSCRNKVRRLQQKGFTLLEVMVAVGVMTLVATGAYMAINAASTSSEVTQQALQRLERIDRTWVLLEGDLRNAVARLSRVEFGEPLPPMQVEFNSEYRLHLLRGGRANPLLLPRTELARIGYRLEDGVLWRDTWYDPARVDPELASRQRLVDDVEEVSIRLLPQTAGSVADGPWLEEWPGRQPPTSLPAAVEITLNLRDMGEVTRLFEVLPGGGEVLGASSGGAPNTGSGGASGG